MDITFFKTVHYWDGADSKLKSTLSSSGEPVNCVSTNGEEVITATNSNRYFHPSTSTTCGLPCISKINFHYRVVLRRRGQFDVPLSSTRLKPGLLIFKLLLKAKLMNLFSCRRHEGESSVDESVILEQAPFDRDGFRND